MNVQRVWAAVLGMAILLAASNMWTRQAATYQVPAVAQPSPLTTSVIDGTPHAWPTRDDDADWTEPHVDLNGNEIDDAVSDYRVDGRGEMYERHAPDTALLHLSAPRL